MAKSSAFLVRSALQALVLLVLAVAGWAAPQQAFAATELLNAAPGLHAGSRQLRGPGPHALDWPSADRCAVTRKFSDPRAEARKQKGAADAGNDAPADAHAILTAAACIPYSESGEGWQPSSTDRGIEATYPAAFQPRAPPSLTH
jgi:hypothetical protein